MKRMAIGALIMALLFVGSRFHLRNMQVIYYYSTTETATLMDCDGELFAIFADDIEAGDNLICLVYGNGKDAVIMDYVEVLSIVDKGILVHFSEQFNKRKESNDDKKRHHSFHNHGKGRNILVRIYEGRV